MLWIQEIELSMSIDALETSQSITGRVYPDSEALDARITTALKKENSSLESQENDLLGGAEGST